MFLRNEQELEDWDKKKRRRSLYIKKITNVGMCEIHANGIACIYTRKHMHAQTHMIYFSPQDAMKLYVITCIII